MILLAFIVALLWTPVVIKFALFARSMKGLGAGPMTEKKVKVSVVVPARNEEADLSESVGSILAQTGIDLSVIIVNDHSTDGTRTIADSLARSDGRVRIIHDPALRDGWFGKVNAMQTGADTATGDYLLFGDADIFHGPDAIARALAEMEVGGYDFISIFPRYEIVPFWENVDLPMYFFGFAQYGSSKLEDPGSPETLAAGAFMLVKVGVFREVGGFTSIRTEMADDIAFAKMLKSKGYRVGVRFSPEDLNVRMLKTNYDAFVGPTKNILMVGKGRPWLAIFAWLISLVLFLTPPAAVGSGIFTAQPFQVGAGIALYLFQYLSFFISRRIFRFHPVKLLAFPLVVIVVGFCTFRALYFYYIKRSVAWRGRAVKVG
jgi:glycosyltransferase involved in cell wall biosynthesis